MNIPAAFTWIAELENLILTIHSKVYRGSRSKNRYRLGPDYIFEINDNRLWAIHNLKSGKSITLIHDEIQYGTKENVSTLAQSVTHLIPEALAVICTPDVYKIYAKADRLNIHWVNNLYTNIVKNIQ